MRVTRKKFRKLLTKKSVSLKNLNKNKKNKKNYVSRKRNKKVKELHRKSLKTQKGGYSVVKINGNLKENQGVMGFFSGGAIVNSNTPEYNVKGKIIYDTKEEDIIGSVKILVDGVVLSGRNANLELDTTKPNENGKIIPQRVTNMPRSTHSRITKSIKQARFLSLI